MKDPAMTSLAKYTLKSYSKPAMSDPVQRRRDKLIAAIELQKLVLAATIKGEVFTLPPKSEGKAAKPVRPWFMAQDGGYYLQCRYGARPLMLDDKHNAVFVKKLEDITAVLTAFAAAAKAGELDKPLAAAAGKKQAGGQA
jgi:hypothetical protein